LTFDAIVSDNENLYIAGHFFYSKFICQLSIDKNGDILWKTKFKQKVDYEFSFLPPKQIVIFNEKIYILSHHYTRSNSFIYSSNLYGKKRADNWFHFKIKRLKPFDNSLFALGHLNSIKDKIGFGKIEENLSLSNISEFELPRNYDYEKAIPYWATKPPTKEELDKKYITSYDINDFEFLNADNLLIVGNSYGKPWIMNLDLDNGINWNWDNFDNRYYKFKNKSTTHYYELHSIKEIESKFLISGISEEFDYIESGFTYHINLFIREIEFEN
jgi:hypothetical protein